MVIDVAWKNTVDYFTEMYKNVVIKDFVGKPTTEFSEIKHIVVDGSNDTDVVGYILYRSTQNSSNLLPYFVSAEYNLDRICMKLSTENEQVREKLADNIEEVLNFLKLM